MRKGSLSILIAIIALLVSTPAFGQLVPRTWVSGVGDDANSCSRTRDQAAGPQEGARSAGSPEAEEEKAKGPQEGAK